MVKWGREITRLRTRMPPHAISGRNSYVRAARLIVMMMMTSVLLLRHRRRNLNLTPISLGAGRGEAGWETGMHAATAYPLPRSVVPSTAKRGARR